MGIRNERNEEEEEKTTRWNKMKLEEISQNEEEEEYWTINRKVQVPMRRTKVQKGHG
jgi:hypothetical protein